MEDIEKLLLNAARFSGRTGIMKYTRFLDPAQAAQAELIARQEKVSFYGWGGYENAERVLGCFYADDVPEHDDYPLCCLSSSFASKFTQITHRDLLGAFMSLGLTRDTLGDIIIVDGLVYLFVAESIADFVSAGLTSAGHAALSFKRLSGRPVIPEPAGKAFSAVISSMRLDAVLAAAYRLSRSEAAEAVRAGLVKVNHIPCERVDLVLTEGALLSLKGEGRVKLMSINGMTKKQRLGVSFFRYE